MTEEDERKIKQDFTACCDRIDRAAAAGDDTAGMVISALISVLSNAVASGNFDTPQTDARLTAIANEAHMRISDAVASMMDFIATGKPWVIQSTHSKEQGPVEMVSVRPDIDGRRTLN